MLLENVADNLAQNMVVINLQFIKHTHTHIPTHNICKAWQSETQQNEVCLYPEVKLLDDTKHCQPYHWEIVKLFHTFHPIHNMRVSFSTSLYQHLSVSSVFLIPAILKDMKSCLFVLLLQFSWK